MTGAAAGRGGDGPEPTDGSRAAQGRSAHPPKRAQRRLALTDPLTGRAAEDRPESWGDSAESDVDRLSHYVAQRPPHHGA
jgi:hypothetical protein